MIHIRIQNKLLVTIRQDLIKGDALFSLLYDLCHALYDSRDKTVDIAFMMYLDRIGYSYLKCFYFADELPNVAFNGQVVFENENDSISFNVTSLFEGEKDDVRIQYMKFGASIHRLM